jgi:hypothetical protein
MAFLVNGQKKAFVGATLLVRRRLDTVRNVKGYFPASTFDFKPTVFCT